MKATKPATNGAADGPIARVAFGWTKATKNFDRYDPVSGDSGAVGTLYLPVSADPVKLIRVTIEAE